MSREQIRVRVDSEQWEHLREEGEGNTELLERILKDWHQLRQVLATLTELDPNPSQALGRLLASHELLSTATVILQMPTASSIPQPPIAEPIVTTEPDLIGGLENNGDDW